ncbi:hypothetical protein RND81_12G150400 [Saponaria officinalis]|uniref:Eukaryotic translation initiation factor 3 subunit A n=1 Tax=Saponaria officinalis TaxID=3572 RepID=A0AAW1HAV9_SAPOF
MSNFQKPENALKRAEEFINVGQTQEALQALHDLITSRKYRAWQKTLEKIMFKYIELCVGMRNGRYAKDGLIQYRSVCQQVNVNSLEEVIKHFMHLSSEKAEIARNQAQALEEALDVEDLEADKRPEDLMLSYVSGEKGKDRSDRELVTPWFKFLWETFRTVLDILRNNSKLESLYAMTAHRAFQFCKQYKRTTEFRRLCEMIRNHLANLNKYKDQRDRPDITAPESLQLYLDTRFEQLKIATELELWQEAFRSVEDIHGLMCLVKKTPKPSLMVVYYAKLTEIFRISGSNLDHAYAWLKLFLLQKKFNKNLSQKDLQTIASSVVLAALSVLPYDHSRGASHLELENEKERNLRMANLINFNLDPKLESREMLSRSALLLELSSKGVMSCVLPEVKDLFQLLEHEFLPLDLCLKAQPLLDKISKIGGKLASASSVPEVQLSNYVPALEKLATLRLLQQASKVYQSMTIQSLLQMVPFFDFSVVEKISVDAVKHKFLTMKIDHMNGAVSFSVMELESDGLKNHLAAFAESLNKAWYMLFSPLTKGSKIKDSLPGLEEIVEKEHKKLLARKIIIEQRKEEQERQLLEKEREEELKKLEHQKKRAEAEQKRLAIDLQRRRNDQVRQDVEERERLATLALLEDKLGKKQKKQITDNMSKQEIMEVVLKQQVVERIEMEKKLQKLAKQMDYLERARREEEAPLIDAAYNQRLVEEQILHEHEQQLEVERSRQGHDKDLQEKNRLVRMLGNKGTFQERIVSRRQADYAKLRQDREEHIRQILMERKLEREAKRKMIFYLKTEEERLNKLKEEEEAREREEKERKKREAAEHQAKLDEIAAKQRQKELEIEEKKRREKEQLLAGEPLSRPSEPLSRPQSEAAPAPAGPTRGRFVPPHLRGKTEASPASAQGAAPSETDRWGRKEDRPSGDKWRSERSFGSGSDRGFGGGSSKSTWSSSRNPPRGGP